MPKILTERRGNILLIGLNRPDKRNAADFEMLAQLADAYGELDADPELRVGVVHAAGDHFTGGLDLADIGPRLSAGDFSFVGPNGIHPWQVDGGRLSKPVVIAVQGTCMTLGVELLLAADIAIAGDSARFGQLEVSRGILPFGGATLRFPRAVGWGNAMRWMLTGELFDAAEAYRIGLVQEVVPDDVLLERALEIAGQVAAQAPLAVQALLRNARIAVRDGDEAAERALPTELGVLMRTEDARIGQEAFLNRSVPQYRGR